MKNKCAEKWFNKIDIRKIVKEHLSTLYYKENNEEIKSHYDRILFFVIPFIISFIVVLMTKKINTATAESLMIFFSIFIPAIFGIFPVIYSFIEKDLSKHGYKLINQFKANVLFIILISTLNLLLLVLNSVNLLNGLFSTCYWVVAVYYNLFLSFLIYYFLGMILLTVLMILQRFNFLINELIKINLRNKDEN